MKLFPILYWPHKAKYDSEYQLARRCISAETGVMPEVITQDKDVSDIFTDNPNAVVYYPVFCGSTGWWGELLGGNAVITDKLIISSSCQLMVIEQNKSAVKKGENQLLAAEIYPSSSFFKKMDSGVATVSDMLATETGTILALFSGKNPNKFISILKSTGNSYLGCIGRY
jgi:hypothetical protein